jgi:hypothetical protein
MLERAAVLGGTLTVRSEPSAGTEVELRVPSVIAYATSLQQDRFQSTTSDRAGDRYAAEAGRSSSITYLCIRP